MPQATLFDADALRQWLRQPVSDDAAAIVEKVVWGWLRPVLNLNARPDVISDELAAWAVELGGIAYSNPEGLSRYALESELTIYSEERRSSLLRLAATGGVTAGGAALKPLSSFPAVEPYPDPVRTYPRGAPPWYFG